MRYTAATGFPASHGYELAVQQNRCNETQPHPRLSPQCLQVHRHHVEGPDPLVYGRTMTGDPESSEGAAVHMLGGHQAQSPVFSVVTYE